MSSTTTQRTTEHLISFSDPPQIAGPASLGPAKQVACFSLCNEKLHVDSHAAMRYFAHPQPNVDLSVGYNHPNNKQRTFKRVRRLDPILEMCLKSKNSKELLNVDVITWCGIVKKIMLGEKMDLNVSFYNGILYIEEQGRREMYCDSDPRGYMGY
ncbi:hypothetical protein R3P38DRAFT_3245843 [Favolaschia claudopus]|uniref:RAI1-like domain-containing protein n=1 Tax=Favolaschia claudopus TaxID=2862362 RepID=A0AAV9YZU8_9AGAR